MTVEVFRHQGRALPLATSAEESGCSPRDSSVRQAGFRAVGALDYVCTISSFDIRAFASGLGCG